MFESAKIPASWFLPSETNIVITNQCMILYDNIGKIWIYICPYISLYYTIQYNMYMIQYDQQCMYFKHIQVKIILWLYLMIMII